MNLFLLGCKLPHAPRAARLHAYGLNQSAIPASTPVNYGSLPAAQAVLANVLHNDVLPDCTTADLYKRQAMRQAASGKPVYMPTDSDVLNTFRGDGGTNTDGCYEDTVQTNACCVGIHNGHQMEKSVGYLAIDPTNTGLVQWTCSEFVGASICMGLPDDWANNMPGGDGFTWDVPAGGWAPNPSSGHCFTLTGWDQGGYDINSWGYKGRLTIAAMEAGARMAGGGSLIIAPSFEMICAATLKAPDMADWAQIIKDFQAMGGVVQGPSLIERIEAFLGRVL